MPIPTLEIENNGIPEMDYIDFPDQKHDIPEFNFRSNDMKFPDVKLPDDEFQMPQDVQMPNLDFKIPSIALPDDDAHIPNFEFPTNFGFDMPEVNLPNIQTDIPDFNIPQVAALNLPDMDINVRGQKLPDFEARISGDLIPDFAVIARQQMVPLKKIKVEQVILVPDKNVLVPHPVPLRKSGSANYHLMTKMEHRKIDMNEISNRLKSMHSLLFSRNHLNKTIGSSLKNKN